MKRGEIKTVINLHFRIGICMTDMNLREVRSTARNLDLAFWRWTPGEFEREVSRVALACAVWGLLILGESAP